MNRPSRGRLRRARRRAGSLACALLLTTALGGLGAGGAAGALGEQCSGANANGLGAYLQEGAQSRWTSNGPFGFSGSADSLACSGSQGSGGTPQVEYATVPSPTALHSWGANDGVFHGESFNFIATDIAPSGPVGEAGTMLAKMKGALGSELAVVPVTQTAIAVAANPPALPAHSACTVPGISAAQLEEVFSGEITNWRQLGAASDPAPGGDCDQAITRAARQLSAGTTYQFKRYLDAVDPAAQACTGEAQRTWAQLMEPFPAGGESPPPNVEWPSNAGCQESEGPVTTLASAFGEGEAGALQFVAENPGTITYGSLPATLQWAPEQVIEVHNGVGFANPAAEGGEANCAAAQYALPEGAEEGVSVDWSQVDGSDPDIGEIDAGAYPICTLSWAVAAADSVGVFGAGAATTVRDYLSFAVDVEAGQSVVRELGYADLPAEVAAAAADAIARIGGSGTVLCKVPPELEGGVLICPPGEGHSGKITGALPAGKKGVFLGSGPSGTIECQKATYYGEFDEDGSANPGIQKLEFGNNAPCETTLLGNPEVGIQFALAPFDGARFTYQGAVAPEGTFVMEKSGGEALRMRVADEEGFKCMYHTGAVGAQVVNGSPTVMHTQAVWQRESGTPGCPEVLQQKAPLTLLAEGLPLYVAGE